MTQRLLEGSNIMANIEKPDSPNRRSKPAKPGCIPVCNWVVKQDDLVNYLVGELKDWGYIVYDPETVFVAGL